MLLRHFALGFALSFSSASASAVDWRYLGRTQNGVVFVDVQSAIADINKETSKPPVSSVGYTALLIRRYSVGYVVPEIRYNSSVLSVDADCVAGRSSVRDRSETWSHGDFVPMITSEGHSDEQVLADGDGGLGHVLHSMCSADLNALTPVAKPNLIGVTILRHGAKLISDLPSYERKAAELPDTKDELP
jgi:hypothetical protein